eukprot:1112931-Pyramimonas_sp.AAC.1
MLTNSLKSELLLLLFNQFTIAGHQPAISVAAASCSPLLLPMWSFICSLLRGTTPGRWSQHRGRAAVNALSPLLPAHRLPEPPDLPAASPP